MALPVLAASFFVALAFLALVLIFGFREFGHLVRQRKTRRTSG